MYEKYQQATKDRCKGCHLLHQGNFIDGPQFCCKFFYPPEKLDKIECLHEQYGYGVLVTPRIKKTNK